MIITHNTQYYFLLAKLTAVKNLTNEKKSNLERVHACEI